MVEMIRVRCSLTRAETGSELAMSVFVYWPKRPQAMLHLCEIGLLRVYTVDFLLSELGEMPGFIAMRHNLDD